MWANSCGGASIDPFDKSGELKQLLLQIHHRIIVRVTGQRLRVAFQRCARPALGEVLEFRREGFAFVDRDAVANGGPFIGEKPAQLRPQFGRGIENSGV